MTQERWEEKQQQESAMTTDSRSDVKSTSAKRSGSGKARSSSDNKTNSEDTRSPEKIISVPDGPETVFDDRLERTYIIGKFLGKGAHARVYAAVDQAEPGQHYALKFMLVESNQQRWDRSKVGVKEVRLHQVLREVEIHGLMNHINIVKLESFFQQESRFCIVLEHCEGNNLAQLLESIGQMGEASSRNLLNQLVDGLEYIHSLGIIHRDLKPANIYLTRQMAIKIGDFGLADRVGSGRKGICGTPNYISPEALMEQGYTPAVDVWALGCIAYHLMAGKPPFDAQTHSVTYDLIRGHRYLPLAAAQAGAGARHLVHWMLSFLPEERPSLRSIRDHVWMKRKSRIRDPSKTWSRRRARRSAPIAQKFNEMTTTSTESSIHDSTILKYERLSDQLSNISLKQKTVDDVKPQPFWKNLLGKVKLKNSPSFHFLPSTFLIMKNKVARNSDREDQLKDIIQRILQTSPAKNFSTDGEYQIEGQDLPVFVSKWIDYSNKFGFGYQMTDGTTGVLFSDDSQICLDGNRTSATFCSKTERSAYPLHSVPSHLSSKVALLENFKEYMDTQLSCEAPQHDPLQIPPVLTSWRRSERAIAFHTRHLIQVNFIADHWKFLFYRKNSEATYSMITINNEKQATKYNFNKLMQSGCSEQLHQYLAYLSSML